MQNRSYSTLKQVKKIGDFQIGKTIGKGTFGKVKEGIHLPTAQKVAIKILQKNRIHNSSDLLRIKYELQILKKVNHPNIIKLLQFHETQKNLYIITQMIEGQELFHLIIQNQKLDEDLCGIYLCQLISAIAYLHKQGICHRDIKPQNIIVVHYKSTQDQLEKDSQSMHLGLNKLKLIDFGLSKNFNKDQLLTTSCGSPCYAAPEMLSKKQHSYNAIKTDIWALGVTVHAMAMGCLPFEADDTERLYNQINGGKYRLKEENREDISENIKKIISDILVVNPKRRLSLDCLLSKYENWFSKYLRILKRYEQVIEDQNKDLIIDSMSKIFSISQAKLLQTIQNQQIQSISTYFYLSWHRTLRKVVEQFYRNSLLSENPQILQHSDDFEQYSGPLHLNFIFNDILKIIEFVETELQPSDKEIQNLNTEEMLRKKKGIHYRGTYIKIKRIMGTKLLYIDFPAYFTMDN